MLARRNLSIVAILLLILAAGAYGGAEWRRRGALRVTNHLRARVPLALAPTGRAVGRDGQFFVLVGAGASRQIIAAGSAGETLWNKQLAEPVGDRPVLARKAVVLTAAGHLLRFRLGGDPLPLVDINGGPGDLPTFDDSDGLLLDQGGALVLLNEEGAPRARISTGLSRSRQVLLLRDGRLLVAGVDGQGAARAFLGLRTDGQLVLTRRLDLPAPPVGLARATRPGELALVTTAAEVLALRDDGDTTRRLLLPGPALAAAVALPGGETAVLCAAAGNGAEVVVLEVDGALRQKVAVTRACGLVGVGAGVVACFDEGGLLSALRGLVAIDGSGVRFRQALPAAPVGLSVTHGGSAVFGVEGDAALFLLDGL